MNPFKLDVLTDKLGPLPVWAWAGIGGVGLAVIAFASRGRSDTGEVILQPGANAQGTDGEFGYGGGFDPGIDDPGDSGAGTPPNVGGGSEGETAVQQPWEFTPSNTTPEAPATEVVVAGGWSGPVYVESGIPVSAGVDMSYLDASLAAIGIFPPPGGWPDAVAPPPPPPAATSVGVIEQNLSSGPPPTPTQGGGGNFEWQPL